MEVVTLLLFVGALWVIAAVGFFAWNLRATAYEHSERMALLPLEDNWTDPNRNPHHQPADREGNKP